MFALFSTISLRAGTLDISFLLNNKMKQKTIRNHRSIMATGPSPSTIADTLVELVTLSKPKGLWKHRIWFAIKDLPFSQVISPGFLEVWPANGNTRMNWVLDKLILHYYFALHTHTITHIHTHTCTHTHTHYINTHASTHAHRHACTHTHTHTNTQSLSPSL